jgi:hypothetical protein
MHAQYLDSTEVWDVKELDPFRSDVYCTLTLVHTPTYRDKD